MNNVDANKIEKKLKQRLTKIDEKIYSSALERTEANMKASKALVVRHIATKSLKALEAILANKPDFEFKPHIAMYIYYAKHDKVNKIFYPNLYKVMKEYEASLQKAVDNDPYYEVYKIMEFSRDKKQNSNMFVTEAVFYINKIIEQNNISINQLAEAAEIKYANVYNLLKKQDKANCVSVRNVHKLLWIANAFKHGWTKEEALLKHKEKMDQLWVHWHVDIDIDDLK